MLYECLVKEITCTLLRNDRVAKAFSSFKLYLTNIHCEKMTQHVLEVELRYKGAIIITHSENIEHVL